MGLSANAVESAAIGSLMLVLGIAACTNKEDNSPDNLAASLQQASQGAVPSAVALPSTQRPVAFSGRVIQSQDANASGVVGDLIESKRADGVLSIRVRFRNTSDQPLKFAIIEARNFESFYVTAGTKKYFILKDSEGTYLTPQAGYSLWVPIDPGQSYVWWAKYPAPPPEIRKINLVTPLAPPFEDIPISDS